MTITPAANKYGSATITVTVKDNGGTANGGADTIVRTFVVTVAKVDQAPTASPDAYGVARNGTLTVAAPGILRNDTDPEGDTLAAVLIAPPSHGTLTFKADGSFVYRPKSGYVGKDVFTYQASDVTLRSKTVAVTLTVGGSGGVKAAAFSTAPASPASTPMAPVGPDQGALATTAPARTAAGFSRRPWLVWTARRPTVVSDSPPPVRVISLPAGR